MSVNNQLKVLLTSGVIAFGALAFSSTAISATVTGSFNVKLTILSACVVSAAPTTNDVTFATQAATNAPTTANAQATEATPITVACSIATPYVINLTPSNLSTTGAGVMTTTPVAGNIPYQLRQATGAAGAVWGNTGTAVLGVVTPGNGVSGVGTGIANPKPYTVYATLTSTDFAPASYTDLVNVSVAY